MTYQNKMMTLVKVGKVLLVYFNTNLATTWREENSDQDCLHLSVVVVAVAVKI